MLISKIKNKILSYYSNIMCSIKKNDTIVWLSLGENCLPDNILQRHHKKSYSSVYSSGRSNIEYALAMDKDNYNNLLDPNTLSYGMVEQDRVVRSTYYTKCSSHYNELHLNGFEFTHHNPLEREEHRNAFKRRISRMIESKGKTNYVFLYHHRMNEKSNINIIKLNLKEFQKQYQINNKKCFIIFFYQTLTNNKNKREITLESFEDNIFEFNLKTEHTWSGHNQDIFWARIDDDLIGEMIKHSNKKINNSL